MLTACLARTTAHQTIAKRTEVTGFADARDLTARVVARAVRPTVCLCARTSQLARAAHSRITCLAVGAAPTGITCGAARPVVVVVLIAGGALPTRHAVITCRASTGEASLGIRALARMQARRARHALVDILIAGAALPACAATTAARAVARPVKTRAYQRALAELTVISLVPNCTSASVTTIPLDTRPAVLT